MKAEIISVGTELLLGGIVDTNAAFISRALAGIGIDVYFRQTVGDNLNRLCSVIKEAITRSDIVITSGGLGATCDDITKEAVAAVLGRKLVLHRETLSRIEEYFAKRNRPMTENNKKQALVPEKCRVINNEYGTAPVMMIKEGAKTIILLPGPPREFCPMAEAVVDILKNEYSDSRIVSRDLRLLGIGEAECEAKLVGLMNSSVNPTLAPYAENGEVHLRISAKGGDEAECEKLINGLEKKVFDIVGEYIFGVNVKDIAEATVKTLRERGLCVSFAESCTGGLLAKRITDVPGASSVIEMSFVTYSNSAKEKLVGVKAETLEKYGAVSPECAVEMAEGLFDVSGSDIALSITGVAGPDTDEGKKIGLIYMAVSSKLGTRSYTFNYNDRHERTYIRHLASNDALNLVRLEALKLK